MNNTLADYILKYSSRVFSMLDRSEYSPTYGCFDRDFWHYKTLTDFPSAVYQQGSLYLACLYTFNYSKNPYYQKDIILKLLLASLDYWVSIQNNDGSFNEWYPNEHSQVATAFTLYAITESLILTKPYLKDNRLEKYFPALLKSAHWLGKNPDKVVINHTAGALTAVYNVYLLTKDTSLLNYTDQFIQIITDNQSSEGWFKEYGGADIGYTSVSIDYLAKYHAKSNDERALKLLDKALSFIVNFIHPDSSCGGEYGNRNTKYLMPAGLYLMAGHFDDARYLLSNFQKGIEKGTLVNPESLDNRYFMFFFASNYLESCLISQKHNSETLGYDANKYKHFSKHFNQAGIVVNKTEKYHFICNYKKGGVIKLFAANGELLYSDSSYFIRFKGNKIASSQLITTDSEFTISNQSDNSIELQLKTPFVWIKTDLPLTKILIPFRMFNYTLGKSHLIMNLFNKYIKKTMISSQKKAPLVLNRRIQIKDSVLTIDDVINKQTERKIELITLPKSASNLHVPSSRYFILTDLDDHEEINSINALELNKMKFIHLKTTLELTGKKKYESSSTNTTE